MKTTRLFLLLGSLLLALTAILPAAELKPVVLTGLDPVALIAGAQKPGRADIFSEFGRFRYLFGTTENKQRFDATPASFAVQLEGGCAMGPEMPGNPALFVVHEGRIFLAGTESCLAEAKADPAQFLKPRALEKRRRVAILIFPGVQIIDYTGPYEVLGQAGYEVYTVAESTKPLKTNMGMTVIPEFSFADAPAPDLIVLPGGNVADKMERSHPAIRWILDRGAKAECLLSVCNGAFWLANAGLLDGLEATTFYGALGALRTGFPKVRVVDDKRFCDNGRIITTAGLSSGIDGSLHMVERFEGQATARSVALNMEYDWRPESGFARGGFADRFLRAAAGRGRFRLDLPTGTRTKLLERAGDRDQWVERYELEEATLTADLLLARATDVLPKNWVAAEAPAGAGVRRGWKFTDEAGAPWTSTLTIEPNAERKTCFVIAVSVRRTGGEKQTAAR